VFITSNKAFGTFRQHKFVLIMRSENLKYNKIAWKVKYEQIVYIGALVTIFLVNSLLSFSCRWKISLLTIFQKKIPSITVKMILK